MNWVRETMQLFWNRAVIPDHNLERHTSLNLEKIEHVHYVKQTAEKWAKPKEDSNDRPGEGPTKTCTSSSFKLKNSYQRNFPRRSDVRDSQRSASPPRAPTAEGVLAVRLLALQQKQKQIKLLPK